MKKLFLTSIIITVCVALYAAVWPQSAGDGKVPGGPAKPAVSAEIETKDGGNAVNHSFYR